MFTINCLQHLIFTQNGILSSISQSLYNVAIHLLYQVYKNEKVNKDTYKTSKDIFPKLFCVYSRQVWFVWAFIREVLTQKKKSVKFHTWGGGSGQNWVIFILVLLFFFPVLNHAKLQRKFFLYGGGEYPLTWKSQFWTILGETLKFL